MEGFYVLSAIWLYKSFCVWLPLALSLLALVVVVSMATICAIYFRLDEQNYRWHWPAFWGPFGVTYYLIVYSLYFYVTYCTYDGALQLIMFVLSSVFLSSLVGIICGFVGFASASYFLRTIYRNLKTD
jgi:transmembrane 9 superfamily protein 3